MMNQQKILITGGTGKTGIRIAERLNRQDTLSGLLDDTLKVECPVLTSLILSEENKDLD
ncbi:hypothetical protein ABFY57_20415 [Paenibacillus polymyxa]|uniref:hypothetical protein n=1 Tax=Paenibacillus polymyxa TaxID=1406 RepID=UPI000A78E449|nr:hypothetical protein [Paenibacillus polymyxa]